MTKQSKRSGTGIPLRSTIGAIVCFTLATGLLLWQAMLREPAFPSSIPTEKVNVVKKGLRYRSESPIPTIYLVTERERQIVMRPGIVISSIKKQWAFEKCLVTLNGKSHPLVAEQDHAWNEVYSGRARDMKEIVEPTQTIDFAPFDLTLAGKRHELIPLQFSVDVSYPQAHGNGYSEQVTKKTGVQNLFVVTEAERKQIFAWKTFTERKIRVPWMASIAGAFGVIAIIEGLFDRSRQLKRERQRRLRSY
jgi:hypothetical protein